MKIQNEIIRILKEKLLPEYLQVINESHKHSVPDNSETHFLIQIVSKNFENKSAVKRQRIIYSLLNSMMPDPIHALSLQCQTLEEFKSKEDIQTTPDCQSKIKL